MQVLKSFIFLQAYVLFSTFCYGKYQNAVQIGSGDNFHFRNCNNSQVPVYIRNFTLEPNPVKLGQFVTGKISFDVTEDIEYIQAELSIRLKTPSGYTEVCELVGNRYCYFKDACYLIKRLKSICPVVFKHGDECRCPANNGTYDNTLYILKTDKLPFELNGTFDITIELYKMGRLLACIDVHFCISKCMS